MNKLYATAQKELKKLEQSQPTWETYEKIATLYNCLQCFSHTITIDKTELSELLQDMRDNFGDERTLDIISSVLCAFKKDIDIVSPHLAQCLINKIKENIK